MSTKQSTNTVLVSKCLLGEPCQFDSKAADRQMEPSWIKLFGLNIIEVCPEELGGLSTPRECAEIVDGDGYDVLNGNAKVQTIDGSDMTDKFKQGAYNALKIANESKATKIIARRRSPSCSCTQIYNGKFSRTLKGGVGVTIALLKQATSIETIELEQFILVFFEKIIEKITDIYNQPLDWKNKFERSKKLLEKELPISRRKEWEEILVEKFKSLIPIINDSKRNSDSDTIRFFDKLFWETYKYKIINNKNRCKVCTMPEGFLDVFINDNGICSACNRYIESKHKFENKDILSKELNVKINEIKGKFKYDAISAFSGGKDSTYMTWKLKKDYGLNLLCVMDNLNQQNQITLNNINKLISNLNVDLLVLDPPEEEKNIRKNFLLSGNHFCRLCLRGHFIRIYEVALTKKIPLIFYGLSPYQCLDCVDAIDYSLQSIREVSTPYSELNFDSIIKRYQHRAFQGGFEEGFVLPHEIELLNKWKSLYNSNLHDFAPLIIPFFIFTEYPDEKEIIRTISKEVEWEKPEIILNRSNCRMLKPAGIIHRAIGRHHLNYKERATALRFRGEFLPEEKIIIKALELENSNPEEIMSEEEFSQFLKNEFNLTIEELPNTIKENILQILTRNKIDYNNSKST